MLGKTGIRVSQICFGSLTVSPLGAGLSEAEGAEVIACALQGGINFIDTAQYYRNYETIKRGISLYTARGGRENPVICTKHMRGTASLPRRRLTRREKNSAET